MPADAPGPIASSLLGQDHPVGDNAAQLRLSQLRAVGHHRPGPRHRHGLTGGDVRRTAHDRHRAVGSPEVDAADLQAVGVGVALGAQHAPDDEAVRRWHAVAVDRLDLRAGHRQALLDPAHVERGIAVLAQPGSGTLI